jgi:hypothetical protein
MVLRKILLLASAAALMSTPAWATDHGNGKGHRPATVPVGPPTTKPDNKDNPGASHRDKRHHGKSHKCLVHKVAYVASGTLVSQTLTKNEDGTYSGQVTVEVQKVNRHASAEDGKTVVYDASKVRLSLDVGDVDKDGTVDLGDLAKGDRVHLIGNVTTLAKRCGPGDSKVEIAIRKIVVHPPAPSTPNDMKS